MSRIRQGKEQNIFRKEKPRVNMEKSSSLWIRRYKM